MHLNEILQTIFKDSAEVRINEIFQELDRLAFCDKSYVCMTKKDLDKTTLTPSERRALLCYISDQCGESSLRQTLEQILGTGNLANINRVEEHFARNGIYTADDVINYGLEIIKDENSIFTQQNATKLENYISKAKHLASLLSRKDQLIIDMRGKRKQLRRKSISNMERAERTGELNELRHNLSQIHARLEEATESAKDGEGRLPPTRGRDRSHMLCWYTFNKVIRFMSPSYLEFH